MADEWNHVGYTEGITVVYDEIAGYWKEDMNPAASIKCYPMPKGYNFENMASRFAATITGIDNIVNCPLSLCPIKADVYSAIVHLNDDHKMSREYIADWLDALPYDFTVKVDDGC